MRLKGYFTGKCCRRQTDERERKREVKKSVGKGVEFGGRGVECDGGVSG